MRYAVILAGGSGVRLWPMSRAAQPKQMIPIIRGRSLLEIASQRLDGLVPPGNRYICALEQHRETTLKALSGCTEDQFLGEPCGRDTVNAVGLSAAVIARRDPEAVIAVFTADHVIEPVDEFQRIVASAYEFVDGHPNALVTFGIAPTGPATGYGYLELGSEIGGGARQVRQFREKPDSATAARYFEAGPDRYLWNSGMFVWRAATLLDCILRYEPATHAALETIADAWDTPDRQGVLASTYPALKKISVDYAVMEPASTDSRVMVAAIPMPLEWLDVGSWPAFGGTMEQDTAGNAIAAASAALQDCVRTTVASSEDGHLIAAVGCEDLIIIHTPDATLVCRADQAESIKRLHAEIARRFGGKYL